MSRLASPDQNSLDQCESALSQAQDMMGYLPNDVLSLCHWPELLQSLSGLVKTILQSGQVDPALKRLIGIISSHTQGCTYCTAHAGYGANQLGVDAEKIAAVFEFETSPLFSAAERAALRVAWHGALQPSAVTDDDIAALTQHFSQPEIVEIVAVLSLYGFLNRWNSTLDTELEAPPADFAQSLSALSKDAQR
jgi:uncharacterized peroxidase-related enzyme